MVGSISKHPSVPRQITYKNVERMKRLLRTHSLALEEEEMEIRSPPIMRSYRSNKTAESQQQTLIEKKSTKGDPSSIDIPTTNNQISGQGIQTDVFFPKLEVAIS